MELLNNFFELAWLLARIIWAVLIGVIGLLVIVSGIMPRHRSNGGHEE